MRASAPSRRSPLWLAALAAAVSPFALPGGPAAACGGFFCNQFAAGGPLPIAQTGENVLFFVDEAASGAQQLEAHVQISYAGPVDRFSWVVPVDGDPTLLPGSNQVFRALAAATQPTFSVNWTQDGTCKPVAYAPSGGSVDGGAFTSADAGAGHSVQVSFQGEVGSFDAAVIRSESASALVQWLTDNKYYVSDQAADLISSYVAERKAFVALKLTSGRSVGEIHPIVMKFVGPSPCVPLRLTAIAALNDLQVNLWVVGRARVVPSNYYEMQINPARIDWLRGGSNYFDLLKQAANEAGGKSFVTDYAGPTSALAGALWRPGRFMAASIAQTKTPPEAIQELIRQGVAADAQLLAILGRQIPEPASLVAQGVTPQQFYNQISFYYAQNKAEFAPFDAAALADELQREVFAPLEHAQNMLDAHAKLTRLTTFISPDEMDLDPIFTFNPTLPDVSNRHVVEGTAHCGNKRYFLYEAPATLRLEDGQTLELPGGANGDANRSKLDAMPALAVAYARTDAGPGVAKFDNREAIAASLRAIRTSAVPAGGWRMPTTGAAGSGAGTGGSGSGGARGGSSDGCSFAATEAPRGAAGALLACLGAIGAAVRRRRR